MLEIAVHGDDVLTACVVEAGGQGRSLAKVAAQFDDRDPAIHSSNFAQQLESSVARPVIDENDLETLTARLHHRLQAVVEVHDILLLIMERDDDGVLRHGRTLYVNQNVWNCQYQ